MKIIKVTGSNELHIHNDRFSIYTGGLRLFLFYLACPVSLPDRVDEDSEPSGFAGVVRGEYATLDVSLDGKELRFSDINGSADFADEKATRIAGKARKDAASFSVEGVVGAENAKLSVEADDVRIEDYLAWVPEGILPKDVEIRGGHVETLTAELDKKGETVSCQGHAELSEGRVRVLETEIRDIAGIADFTEKEMRLAASAEAEGQRANVHGRIAFSGEAPELYLTAQSE